VRISLAEPDLDITAAATAALDGGHRRGGDHMPGAGPTDGGAWPLPTRERTQPDAASDGADELAAADAAEDEADDAQHD